MFMHRIRWFGKRELLASLLGSLLYFGVNWFTSFARLSSGLGLEFRPAIAVPIVFGFVYGPVAGFLVGVVGNTLGDYVLFKDIWWQWSVGNGLMGLVPGFYALWWPHYRALKQVIVAYLVTVLGILAGMGFASFSTIWICREGAAAANCYTVPTTPLVAWQTFVPVVKVNVINALILVPLLLFNIERLDLSSRDSDSFGAAAADLAGRGRVVGPADGAAWIPHRTATIAAGGEQRDQL